MPTDPFGRPREPRRASLDLLAGSRRMEAELARQLSQNARTVTNVNMLADPLERLLAPFKRLNPEFFDFHGVQSLADPFLEGMYEAATDLPVTAEGVRGIVARPAPSGVGDFGFSIRSHGVPTSYLKLEYPVAGEFGSLDDPFPWPNDPWDQTDELDSYIRQNLPRNTHRPWFEFSPANGPPMGFTRPAVRPGWSRDEVQRLGREALGEMFDRRLADTMHEHGVLSSRDAVEAAYEADGLPRSAARGPFSMRDAMAQSNRTAIDDLLGAAEWHGMKGSARIGTLVKGGLIPAAAMLGVQLLAPKVKDWFD